MTKKISVVLLVFLVMFSTDMFAATYTPIYGLSFYKPNYILPYYYTQGPDYDAIYQGTTPDNQKILPEEFKANLSIKFSFFHNIIGKDSAVNIAYSQLMYWQFYASSQYFRETNYEPEIFLAKKFYSNYPINIGIEHQSNGQGGFLERSWNRAFVHVGFVSKHFYVDVKPWLIVFKTSIYKHNPDIEHYMGHGELTLASSYANITLSVILRNIVESRFHRGAEKVSLSIPLYKSFRIYLQGFSGYGQSLITYNRYALSGGVGISLSDWI